MPYEAVFFKQLPQGTSVHEHFDSGRFRATVELRTGAYDAIGFTPLEETSQQRSVSLDLCLPSDIDCDLAVLHEALRFVSKYRPEEVLMFALAHIRPGSMRRWVSSVAEAGERDDVKVAVAYVDGVPRANVLLELVGSDRAAADAVLLDLLDREEVRDFTVMHTTADRTRGFGGEEAASVS